ncbi:MAG: SMC-Scp complex subunit ScpB [Gammaproteobacteria bacterium]|nr:SMC-Scp complex subunit ScpB [Gammaproteobacteria bacterium]
MSDTELETGLEADLDVDLNVDLNMVSSSGLDQKQLADLDSLNLNQEQFRHLKLITESLLMASDKPLSIKNITHILDQFNENPNTRVKDKVKYNIKYIKLALDELTFDLSDRAIEIKFLGTAYRIQTKAQYAPWVQELWQEKPTKYTKATLETLAIIAYRQPITRGEIENIRGVAVSSQIIRNLLDREWVKVVGHKELPGRPAIYATTQQFLYDLNLEKLEDLPTLADIVEIKQNLLEAVNLEAVTAEENNEEQ